jgi:phenylalanyl-tRNA synthetase beta chain
MVFSYNLLSKLVDLSSISVEDLVNRLTFSGFEVEGYSKVGEASNLVVGKVLSCEAHPDSDHLHVLKVDVGQNGVLDIVCGAPNVKKDQKVIIAQVGAVLPRINLTIRKGEIRGKVSNGMCCSLIELGVDKNLLDEENATGICVLDDSFNVGDTNILERLGLDDYALDINILPNRPDCLSHLGLAREISSLFNTKLYPIDSFDFEKKLSSYKVNSVSKKCKLFNFVELNVEHNIKSPLDLVSYLRTCGIRTISLIVDLGNLSMLLTGQPLHMYDLDKLDGNLLEVRDDIEQKVIALDEKEYSIIKDDLVVCDKNKNVMCIAGINGTSKVKVDENTTHIGIEAANFYYANIRHTSNRLGLASASSNLYIKGVNPYLGKYNLDVTMSLFNKYLPNFNYLGYSTYNNVDKLEGGFDFSVDKLNHHLGSNFSVDKVKSILDNFYLKYDLDSNGKGIVYFDKFRLDLINQCDIDEEVYRTNSIDTSLYKYSVDNMPQMFATLSETQLKEKKIRQVLVENGLNQVISYSLVNAKLDRQLRIFDNEESYKLLNPITEDHMYIRSDLLSSLYNVANYNIDRKNEDIALFEISNIDTLKGNRQYLAFILAGEIHNQDMINKHTANFFDAKGIFENITQIIGLDEKRYTLVRSKNSNLHPYKSADVYIGKTLVGSFGHLNPQYYSKDMVVCELDLQALINQKTSKLKCKPLNNLQPIRRDLAFKILDSEVTCSSIISEIKRSAGKYVLDVKIFDVFTKNNETSYAFAIYLIKEDKSFTDDEINSILNNIILSVTKKLKVELK